MWKENYYKLIFPALSEKDNIIWKVSEADDTVKFIESLLKQQREICAEEYIKQRDYHVARTITSDVILNAPEPTGEKE